MPDALLPGPDDQDIDLDAPLPTPEELGEPPVGPVASHGDFHDRPGFEPGLKPLYCPCADPLDNPDAACPVHGGV